MLTGLLIAVLAQAPFDVAALRAMSPVEQRAVLESTPPEAKLQVSREIVERLGTYRYRMKKQERVKGELKPVEETVVSVRETPFAVRMEWVGDRAKGRRALYNPALRKTEFRVKEGGLLSIAGGLWLSLDGSLAKKETNHAINEAGLGNLVKRLERDLGRARAEGGLAVKHEGPDARGHFCALYTLPNRGQGFSAPFTRICEDVKAGVPGRVESFDLSMQLLERYEVSEVETLQADATYFTLSGAKL